MAQADTKRRREAAIREEAEDDVVPSCNAKSPQGGFFLSHSGNHCMMKPEKMPDDKKVKKLWLQRFFFVSLQKIINTNEDSFRIAKYCKTGT